MQFQSYADLRTVALSGRLLITDVGMPNGMNGRQKADTARSLRPDLKVLFIIGYAENAAVESGHLEPRDGAADQALYDGNFG